MRRRLLPIRAVAFGVRSAVPWMAFISSCVAMRLTLRFDGSLRAAAPSPARVQADDAGSSSTEPTSSFVWVSSSTEPTERIAACAASLHLDSGDDDSGRRAIVALGGRLLDSSQVALSGQAEYEGLLLGLAMMSDWVGSSRDTEHVHRKTVELDTLRIQGDCKTVIEQIQGRSRPRKLEAYWARATSLLSSFNTRCYSTDMSPAFVAEHIPRQRNTLCDAVASHIVIRQHGANARELWNVVESYPRLRDAPLAPSLTELLHDVKRLIHPWLRPTFYVRLAVAAWSAKAYGDVASAGQLLEKEVKAAIAAHRRRPADISSAGGRRELAELHATSAMLQILGCRMAGQFRESDRLCRRHKHALDGHPELVRAMEQVMEKNGSFSDAMQQWLDVSPPMYDDVGPKLNPDTTQDESAAIKEWSRRAFSSKEWDENRSYVLRFSPVASLS
jgi:ribonuclease HI